MRANLKFSKRGQSLSMNVIIIAILALLVLVVLSLIFIKNQDDFEKKSNATCRILEVGAKCVAPDAEQPDSNYVKVTGKTFNDCPLPNECFVPVGSKTAEKLS